MTYIHPPRSQLGNRFAQPAKETLVGWINEKNNRGFYAKQFTFKDPIKRDDDGSVDIPFIYNDTGEKSILSIQRINIGLVPGLQNLAIYPDKLFNQNILDAIYKEYGLYLDLDMVDIILENLLELCDLITVTDLSGLHYPVESFDGKPGEESNAVTPDELSDYLDPRWHLPTCRIVMRPNHLVYEGELVVTFQRSVLTNPNTLARNMNLRTFYSQTLDEKPYVETFQSKGLWTIHRSDTKRRDKWSHSCGLNKKSQRELESNIYHLKEGGQLDYTMLAELLTRITNTKWLASHHETAFNVMNSIVLYNGLASDKPGIAPITHSHLLVLELSDLCENLQGRIHIAYSYSTPNHPAAYPGGYNILR